MSEDISNPIPEGNQPKPSGENPKPDGNKPSGGSESGIPEWFTNPQAAWEAFVKVQEKAQVRLEKLEAQDAQVKALEAEKRRAQEQQLEAQGQFKELAESRQATIAELENTVKATRVETAIIHAAYQQGFADPADAVALVDKSKIVYEGGTVQGVAEAVKALAEAKPHLLKTKRTSEVPDHNPSGQQKPDVRDWHPLTRKRSDAFRDGGVTYLGKDE